MEISRIAFLGLASFSLGVAWSTWAQEPKGQESPVLPTGTWAGQGVFVDYKDVADADPTKPAKGEGESRGYSTSLTVRQDKIDGNDVLVLEIQSKRGKTLHLDDEESRVRLALKVRERFDNGSVAYDRVAWDYDAKEGAPLKAEEGPSLVLATSIRSEGATVLQVYYQVAGPDRNGDKTTFHDTITFKGDQVQKVGSIIELDREATGETSRGQAVVNSVYWAETLSRKS